MSHYNDDYIESVRFSVRYPVARKEHKCGECQGTIKVGQRYKKEFGLTDGTPDFRKSHLYGTECELPDDRDSRAG